MKKNRSTTDKCRIGTLALNWRHTLPAAMAGILMLAGQNWAVAEDMPAPENMRSMTGVELYMLYRNKSWRWPTGAGRMQDEGRIFTAWSGSGSDASWAVGRWIVTDSGLLCLKADWHSKAGTYNDKTCFRHKTDGRMIYQKNEKQETGDWYVFRHAEPEESDEANELVRQDLVSDVLNTLRNPSQQPDQEQAAAELQSLTAEETGGEVQ